MRSSASALFFFVFLAWWCCDDLKAQSTSDCDTPNQEKGTCLPLDSCPILLDAITTTDDQVKKFLRESLCGWETQDLPRVCCGTKASYSTLVQTESKINVKKDLLPDRSLCGFQDDKDKVLGGENTGLKEFPWVALLGYTNRYNRLSFGCGGALISKRYVLTAGHCITTKLPLTRVRLGEWNLNTTYDCVGRQPHMQCIQSQDFEIESTKLHEKYNYDAYRGLTNDIALIRLKTPVEFTTHIQPICLPTSTENSDVGAKLWVAGWGATETQTFQKSVIKQKLEVPIVESSECETKYKTRGNISIINQQLCAGGEVGKDSCKGDSGGPLMATSKTNDLQYYLEGIVSFGISCGSELPGVYTRVTEYLGWIENNIAE